MNNRNIDQNILIKNNIELFEILKSIILEKNNSSKLFKEFDKLLEKTCSNNYNRKYKIINSLYYECISIFMNVDLHMEVIFHLLHHGADINLDINNKTVFNRLIIENDIESIRYILSNYYVDINKIIISNDHNNGMNNVLLSIRYNRDNLDILELLLSNDGDINQKMSNGNNALHVALDNQNIEVIYYLIINNLVNINEPNKEGFTPLFYMCKRFFNGIRNDDGINIIKLLLSKGINLDEPIYYKDREDVYLLECAIAYSSSSTLLKYLINNVSMEQIIKLPNSTFIKFIRHNSIKIYELLGRLKNRTTSNSVQNTLRKRVLLNNRINFIRFKNGTPNADGHIAHYLFNNFVARNILTYQDINLKLARELGIPID
jgi:ankyrin repeat protein